MFVCTTHSYKIPSTVHYAARKKKKMQTLISYLEVGGGMIMCYCGVIAPLTSENNPSFELLGKWWNG